MNQAKILIPSEFKELFNSEYRYFAVYGGRGSLKSHTIARRLIIASRENKVRILCTRELQKSIKDSVHKLLKDLIVNEFEFTDFTIKQDSIINDITGSEFIFTGIRNNTNEIKSMEGIDFCWAEEAHSLTHESLDILTPTIRKPGSQLIFSYNRLNELDPVHERFVLNTPPGTCVINVNYPVAQKYGWFPDVLEQEMLHDKETDPELYAHKWLGEPLAQTDAAILNRGEVLKAMERDIEDDGQIAVGVDVARMGRDRTVFWKRKGLKTTDVIEHSKLRTTEVCDKLEHFVDYNKDTEIKIDDTGVGGGVTDEMMARGYNNIIPINFGSKADDPDKYPNLISEAWFYLKSILPNIELPKNNDLLMELSARQWKQDARGKRRVESKDDYKKRGFRSPDLADACIICYYNKQGLLTLDDFSM